MCDAAFCGAGILVQRRKNPLEGLKEQVAGVKQRLTVLENTQTPSATEKAD